MTTQNLVNLSLTETQIANVDAAVATLETELAGLIALSATDTRRMRKMGNKSESFSPSLAGGQSESADKLSGLDNE